MKFSLKDRVRYRFEQFLNKGGSSIFLSLLIVFISAFIIIATLRITLIKIFPSLNYTNNLLHDVWITFLEMTSTGSMQQDTPSPPGIKVLTILSGLVGVVLLSMLIAFITTTLNKFLYDFRKGRGRIIEENHTLIFGWNERIVDVIKELILANESEKDAAVVILSNKEKEIMDDLITKRIPESQSTRIITTQGDYANLSEQERVNTQGSRSIIILANCSENASYDDKLNSDIIAIKSILAITSKKESLKEEIPIIAEVYLKQKRKLISFFDYENIITLDSWEIMGKLLIQTSLTSGLDAVYGEMLSFDGGELYFHEEGNWEGTAFNDLVYHFKDGIPLGYYNKAEGVQLRPEEKIMTNDDQVIIFAEDDSTIHYDENFLLKSQSFSYEEKKLEQIQRKILIIGWHPVAQVYIKEAADYLLENSQIDILFKDPPLSLQQEIAFLQKKYPDFNINLMNGDSMNMDAVAFMKPFTYHNVIILSQSTKEQEPDKIDSDTLVILLILRKLKKENLNSKTKIITQVLNSDNQKIIAQTHVDDFIISNKLITMILAQMSEQPLIKKLYDDLFSEDGSEIYVKPAYLYFNEFPISLNFIDIIDQAKKRDEICLGFRKGSLSTDLENNFGIKLNPPKDELINI